MNVFNFYLVFEGERLVSDERVPLPDIESVWPRIAKLVEGHNMPGLRVVVTNENDGIVVAAAASVARRLLDQSAAAA